MSVYSLALIGDFNPSFHVRKSKGGMHVLFGFKTEYAEGENPLAEIMYMELSKEYVVWNQVRLDLHSFTTNLDDKLVLIFRLTRGTRPNRNKDKHIEQVTIRTIHQAKDNTN